MFSDSDHPVVSAISSAITSHHRSALDTTKGSAERRALSEKASLRTLRLRPWIWTLVLFQVFRVLTLRGHTS